MANAKAYWKFMLSKAFRTGLQSAISLWLANSSGIIDADVLQLVGVAFLTSFGESGVRGAASGPG